MGRSTTHGNPETHPTTPLVPVLTNLLQNSLAPSTTHTYNRSLSAIINFLKQISLPITIPIMPVSVALYVSHLFQQGYAYRSIISSLSPISYIHKCQSLPDPVPQFLVQRALQGIKKSQPTLDARLPITLKLLHRLCEALKSTVSSPRDRTMFQSMFLLAFYAFLRVGEFTLSNNNISNILQLDQIQIDDNYQRISVTFKRFKHSNGRSHSLVVRAQRPPYCPVLSITQFLQYRGSQPGPLFTSSAGIPIRREVFVNALNKCLRFLSLSTSCYKSHSFRIGAASHSALMGMSDIHIRYMGRWNYGTFLTYIRLG